MILTIKIPVLAHETNCEDTGTIYHNKILTTKILIRTEKKVTVRIPVPYIILLNCYDT